MNTLCLKNNSSIVRLIVGLGNEGEKFRFSRHNVGFNFIETLKTTLENNLGLVAETTSENEYTSYYFRSIAVTLLKPKLFMNRSGDSLLAYLKYKHLKDFEEMLVIHDDLDIPFGKYKLHLSKSPKSHNGILSIESALKTTQFFRLRIGIDNRADKTILASNFVLMNMNKTEKTILDELMKQIIKDEFMY